MPIPYPVPCISAAKVPVRPELYAESAWASTDEFERGRALLLDRKNLLAYVRRLEAVLIRCVDQE